MRYVLQSIFIVLGNLRVAVYFSRITVFFLPFISFHISLWLHTHRLFLSFGLVYFYFIPLSKSFIIIIFFFRLVLLFLQLFVMLVLVLFQCWSWKSFIKRRINLRNVCEETKEVAKVLLSHHFDNNDDCYIKYHFQLKLKEDLRTEQHGPKPFKFCCYG